MHHFDEDDYMMERIENRLIWIGAGGFLAGVGCVFSGSYLILHGIRDSLDLWMCVIPFVPLVVLGIIYWVIKKI